MIKFFAYLICLILILIGSIFFIPISAYLNHINSIIKPNKIEYSTTDGNIFNSNIYDVYINNYDVGDFNLKTSLSFKDISLNLTTDDKFLADAVLIFPLEGINKGDYSIFDLNIEERYDTKIQGIGELVFIVDINEANFISNQCITMRGILKISGSMIGEPLTGNIQCNSYNDYKILFYDSDDRYRANLELKNNELYLNVSSRLVFGQENLFDIVDIFFHDEEATWLEIKIPLG